MKKENILLLILLFCFSACEKENKEGGTIDNSVAQYRVKEIKGKNASWGDYTYKFYYNAQSNEIDSAFRYDAQGRRQGNISRSTGDNDLVTYNINDLVNSIDADSVKRMEAKFKELYGEGNYSLFDSIPRVGRALYSAATSRVDGDLKGIYTYYKQRKEFGVGNKFDNTYIILKKETVTYEYDKEGNILNCRAFEDTYEDGNPEIFKRAVYKSEFIFSGGKVITNNIYVAESSSPNTWDLLSGREFTYSGNNLQTISGEKYNVTYTYVSGKLTTVQENDIKYEVNENGCVTRIEYANGDFMNMQYEAGAGNFDRFAKVEYKQTGIPTIR